MTFAEVNTMGPWLPLQPVLFLGPSEKTYMNKMVMLGARCGFVAGWLQRSDPVLI